MQNIEERTPALVLVLSIITCGIYLIYWYYKMYEELTILTDRTPTGNEFILDLVLAILTCGLWGIYVDYKISLQLAEAQQERGLGGGDMEALVIILDVAAYFTVFITYYISSAIQQDAMNKIVKSGIHRRLSE